MKRNVLQPAPDEWPLHTPLQVDAPGQMQAPHYIWHEKTQDFILAGFVKAGTVVTYVHSWQVRGQRYAECQGEDGTFFIFISAHVTPTTGESGS